jgi:hypothetical protein
VLEILHRRHDDRAREPADALIADRVIRRSTIAELGPTSSTRRYVPRWPST